MIEKLDKFDSTEASIYHVEKLYAKVNQLVDAVNNLQTTNTHIQNDLHEMRHSKNKIRSENVQDRMIGCTTLDIPKTYKVDPYVEQRRWEGKLCWFWDGDPEDKIVDVLSCIDISDKYPYVMCDHQVHYKHCEPVKPDDDIIYKGE